MIGRRRRVDAFDAMCLIRKEGSGMIARSRHGVTPASKVDESFDYCSSTGVPDLRATEGNRGVYLLRKIHDGKADFMLIPPWQSFDAIHRFAGTEVDKARYYPRDEDFLEELEPTVTHYDVVAYP